MSDHWGTPRTIRELVRKSTGYLVDIMHDPCPYNGSGGLENHWHELNFVNPPFSDPGPWIRKAKSEFYKYGRRTIMVLPAFTDRAWWLNDLQQELIACRDNFHVVHIGRHQFVPLEGQKESSPRFGCCLVFFGFSWESWSWELESLVGLCRKNKKRPSNKTKAE